MAYTTIPNTDIDQDSPITQPLMTALRDNTDAILYGITTGGFYAAGDWQLLDIMSPTSNVNAVVSTVDPSAWAAVRVFGIGNKDTATGEDFQIEIRNAAGGTWRQVAFLSTGTNQQVIFDVQIFNTDNNDSTDLVFSSGVYTDDTSQWAWNSTGTSATSIPGNAVLSGIGGYGDGAYDEIRVSMTGGANMEGATATTRSRFYVFGMARAQSDATS